MALTESWCSMEQIKKIVAKAAFAIANGVIRIMYPPNVTWEDKKATKEALKNPCVIYSNHTSHIDGFYLTRLLGRYKVHTFVARDWYDKKKLNWLFRNLPYIPMNRQEMDTSWLPMGLEKMKEGCPIYIFPEGHTSKTGEMDEFKPGFLMLARQGQAAVVPICIDGTFRLFHRMHIIIGKPVELDLNEEGRPSVVLKKCAKVCRQRIYELKDSYGIRKA